MPFGRFLIRKNIASEDVIRNARQIQQERNQHIGELAVRLGYMSFLDMKQLVRALEVSEGRFGELAVEQGLLTREQVETLISEQDNQCCYLGDILIEMGILTKESLANLLEEFERSEPLEADQG